MSLMDPLSWSGVEATCIRLRSRGWTVTLRVGFGYEGKRTTVRLNGRRGRRVEVVRDTPSDAIAVAEDEALRVQPEGSVRPGWLGSEPRDVGFSREADRVRSVSGA